MRGKLVERLGELEVIFELCAFGFLAFHHTGVHGTAGVHTLAHLTDEVRIQRKTVHQDGSSTVEGLLRFLETFGEVLPGQLGRVRRRVLDKLIGQRLQACLTRDIRLGFATLLIRQVQIL